MINTLSYVIPFGLFAIFMSIALVFAIKSQKRLKSVMSNYAVEHGWSYNTEPPTVPLFQRLKGYNAKDKTFIEGSAAGRRFWLYRFWWGVGGNPGTQPPSYYLCIELPFELPTLIVAPKNPSKTIDILERLNDSLTQVNLKLTPLKLKGDIDNRFSVLVEKGHEQVGLQYLTPDFLAVLEQQVRTTVTLSSHYISINASTAIVFKNKQTLDDLFVGAEALLKTLPAK
jgi:hypothetical protein